MFPSGKILKTFENAEPREVIASLEKNKFTGYAAFTAKNKDVHDYCLAFLNGEATGAFHENLKTKQLKTGEEAMKEISPLLSLKSMCDVVSLSQEQVELALAVRPEARVKYMQEEKPLVENADESSRDILKKYGLTTLVD